MKVKLTMNELFSGIGSQKRGIDETGLFDLEVVSTSDIEHNAVTSYAAIHKGLTREMVEAYKPDKTYEEMADYLSSLNMGYDFQKNKPYDWRRLARRRDKYEITKYYLACKMINNVGDISRVKQLEYADLWTYSFPCFVAGTMVLTDKGYVPIEKVERGMYVLTHTNTYQKVVKPMCKIANEIYRLKTMPSDDILVTEEHPFYVRKRSRPYNNELRRNVREFSEPEWVKVKDLSKDYYVGIAINQKSELPKRDGFNWSDGRETRKSNRLAECFESKDFWYLIGRYMRYGWFSDDGGIIICCPHDEVSKITDVADRLGFNSSVSRERTCTKVHIPFQEIGAYCKQFGKGASNKRLTSDIINLPINLLEHFLLGYLESDGCKTEKRYKFTSVSRELIYGIGQCVAKVFNRPYSICHTKRKPNCVIEDRVVNQKDTYTLVFKKETDKQDKAFYENGYIWAPINDIKKEDYNGLVYNMEVEKDNSYTVNNIIVHNCQSVSVAGKQEGIVKGETRSGLLYEVERLLEKAKETDTLPKYLLLENVKNLVSVKFKPVYMDWLDRLEELGYNTYWQVVNGKNCGVPQNRERVFGISIRKDIDTGRYEFMQPFDNGLRLKDMLEDEVDGKYYLSPEIQGRFKLTDTTMTKNIVGTTAPECRTIGQRDLCYQPNGIMGALTSSDYKQPKQIIETPNALKLHTMLTGGKWDKQYESVRKVYDESGIAPTILTCQGGNKEPKVAILNPLKGKTDYGWHFEQQVHDINGITRAIKAGGGSGNIPKAIVQAPKPNSLTGATEQPKSEVAATVEYDLDLLHTLEYLIRKLTPKECFRLMGFRDSDIDKCYSLGLIDSHLYKQAGNSIITKCIKLLFDQLYIAQYESQDVTPDDIMLNTQSNTDNQTNYREEDKECSKD